MRRYRGTVGDKQLHKNELIDKDGYCLDKYKQEKYKQENKKQENKQPPSVHMRYVTVGGCFLFTIVQIWFPSFWRIII